MKSMLDIVTWVVGLAATVFAIYKYYQFATHPDTQGGHSYLYWAIAATVVAFICALIFFVRRVNKEEEIHITQ
jgi:uncharacterized membrane protein